MKKLTILYGKKKTSDIQYLMKKMYSVKAKTVQECREIITEILDIFEKLEDLNVT